MMVAVQARRSDGVSGNAEMPGVAESISCINSVCRLDGGWAGGVSESNVSRGEGEQQQQAQETGMTYRLVTLWASCLRGATESFAASCTVGWPGAEFCVSSIM